MNKEEVLNEAFPLEEEFPPVESYEEDIDSVEDDEFEDETFEDEDTEEEEIDGNK